MMRIVALLCSLARLAELAAGCSPVVRCFLLWLLRHAEAVALDFVAGDKPVHPHDVSFASMSGIPSKGSPAEALRLAVSLRLLALMLESQANLMPAMGGRGGGETQPPYLGRMRAMPGVAGTMALFLALAARAPPPDPGAP